MKPGKYKLRVDPDFLPSALEADDEVQIEVHGKEKIDNVKLPIKFKSRPEEIKIF